MFGNLTNLESSLFDQFRRMEEEMDEMLGRLPGIRSAARGSFPPVNVGVTPDKVNVYLFSPGLDVDSLDVSIQQNVLTVAGQRKATAAEGAKFYRRERFAGEFRRVITLPDDIDPDQVTAQYTDGVLQVSVQRRESSKPRKIQIQ